MREYGALKRALKKRHKIHEIDAAFDAAKRSLIRAREKEYVAALRLLREIYPDRPRVAVLRLQKNPEGYRQPPIFADVVIVWNPLLEGEHKRKMTWSERAQTAAPTIAAITGYLESSGIVSSIHKRRQGLSIAQEPGNALFFDDLYQKLFGRRPKHY